MRRVQESRMQVVHADPGQSFRANIPLVGHRKAAFDLQRTYTEGLGASKSQALCRASIRRVVEKCPSLPDGDARCDELDHQAAALHGFFNACHEAPIRNSWNLACHVLAKTASEWAKIKTSGSAGPGTSEEKHV